ncbi:MAG: aldo/keto reductase [Mogibacterium sp.]|nr:aldo/keto reductase [Mogibacterium sp.]
MQYREDKKSGNKLSILGFGCMRFAGGDSIQSFSPFSSYDEEYVEKLLVDSVEQGINYFDTAYLYNGSEAMLGKTLAKHGLREKVFIATKLPVIILRKAEDIDKCFNVQLERLQTDYIDYYLMHMLTTVSDWERLCSWGIESWIEKQKAGGRIKQIGFSFHGAYDEFEKLLDVYDWDFVQIQYNYSDENYQAGVKGLHKAAEKDLPVIIMEPLLGGRLADGLPSKAVQCFKEADPNSTPVSWALRWLWNQPEVTVVLSGMNKQEQLIENLETADKSQAGMLTDAEEETFSRVKQIIKESYKVNCTGCKYCMPCPAGVDIPTCFAAYNTSSAIDKGIGAQQYLMSTLMYNRSGYASLCKNCGKCETHCPQHIEIRKELKAVSKELERIKFKAAKLGVGLLKIIRK